MKTLLQLALDEYHKGTPILTDAEYDKLAQDNNYYELGVKGKFNHKYRMYSLQKVYDNDPAPISGDTVESDKLDGAAISLQYYNGSLVNAITRGDGEFGECILDKAYHIPSIPKHIGITEEIQVVGEIVVSKDIPNARNLASGTLGLKDIDIERLQTLDFIAYGVYPYLSYLYSRDMQLLSEIGFYTVLEHPKGKYPTDGKVYRLNNNKDFDNLGYTAKHPRGAYARKISSEVTIANTTLLDVVWQVGQSGKVTPVGVFEPVNIDGATVSRASLSNIYNIRKMGLEIGGEILVTRRGGIIPYILGRAN